MAIYSFITDKDLDLGMKLYYRNQITNGTTNMHIMKTCEGASFSMIKTKLNNKYDLVKLFPVIEQWLVDTDYLAGQYSYQTDKIYIALQDGTGKDPATETTYWKEKDPRDQLLVQYAACMTIYLMMESIPTRLQNKELENMWASIMEWLDEVKDGKENPAWDLLASGGSTDIPWGSNDKIDQYYN